MATATGHEKLSASELLKSLDRPSRRDLQDAIEKHKAWLESGGAEGQRADFSGKNLEDADLVDARLREAVCNRTILQGADLTLADLRDSTLVQANLAEATLLGTQFQHANLQAAEMHGAAGLVSSQLAGANLYGATVPEAIAPMDGLTQVRATARKAEWFLASALLLNALVWLRIFTTPDAQLIRNAPALPVPGLQSVLPFIPFYLFGPVVMLCLYLCFHLYMQRLWDGIAQLPAIFPDGRRLDSCLPWFSRWSARRHFLWLRKSQTPLAFLEAAFAILLLYWVTPATMLLFWARYMTLEDLRGTSMHILLVAGAVLAALNFPKLSGRAFRQDSPRTEPAKKALDPRLTYFIKGIPAVVALFLFLVSIGTFLGVPHDYRASAPSPVLAIRLWAPDLLWTVGYNPFAQLTEADVSVRPAGWTGGDEQLSAVRGANLNGLRLRYIQAYGAFLAKAHLWNADLRNSFLSEADLREANLRQVNLQFAILDRARLTRATLPEANLRGAVLDQTDLREANLSFASLSSATMLDAIFDGANLYKSDLQSASLQRASLKKADLREAGLSGANLTSANLEGSYLISAHLDGASLKNANLSQAILTDADLRQANLSGAVFEGAVLQNAELDGANLQGADLRSAGAITATQVCAADSLRDAQMDATLQQDVMALCANKR